MATTQMSGAVQNIRRVVLARAGAPPTDGQLLEDHLQRRDGAALAVLVQRHGPMVWGVCRRLLPNHHDAEDAFQATFLVLVRRAASIAAPELLANWLYGVAHQTARKARGTVARRRARERQVTAMPEPAATERDLWNDLLPLLDRELSRLADIYRAAVVLCDLEGKTRTEAARQLGVPEGTLAARLGRGRAMLAQRLTRRGVTLSGALLGVLLARNGATASVPASVSAGTIQAATLFAAGPGAAAGVISPAVAALTEGVLKAMLLTKLKIAALVLLVAAVLGTGAGVLLPSTVAGKPPVEAAPADKLQDAQTELSGVVKSVDAARNTVTLHPGKQTGEQTFTLVADIEVLLDDGTGDRLGFQKGKSADIAEGAPVTLRLGDDRKVTRILVEGPSVQGVLKAVDADRNTITATVAFSKTEPAVEKTFALAKNVRLSVEGQPVDKTKPAAAPRLADLPAGAVVALKLSADRKTVGSLRAEGQSVAGVVKAADGAKGTVTITISVKGEPDADRTFPVAKDASVFVDDGKPIDKSKPSAQGLADLPVGARVTLRLSLDGRSVVAIRAEGGHVVSSVKAVDAGKGTLTIDDKIDGERTYAVMKDAPVFIDGKGEVRSLADVPVGSVVDLKLLTDQKTVRAIHVSGPTVYGDVVGNAANDSITVGNKEGEATYPVAKGARVLIADKGQGKLADLINGTVVQLRLSADKLAVLELRAEGPSFRGTVKALDREKNTITLTIGAKNGEGGEDKTFNLTKDTAVVTEINGAALTLKDVRAEKEVVLRLGVDQKSAAHITVLGE